MPNMPDAVILCGGAGLRLKSITGDTPKPMARIAGRPFLELLLSQLKRYDFSHVVLSVGYKHDDIRTDTALVMNGDSYAAVDLGRLVLAHRKGGADATVVVIAETRSDAGSVLVDENGRVTAFAEKSNVLNTRYQSAGIYMFNKTLCSAIPRTGKVSLEEQLFSAWLANGRRIDAFGFSGGCIDIGTPERYLKAQNLLASVERDATMQGCEGQL